MSRRLMYYIFMSYGNQLTSLEIIGLHRTKSNIIRNYRMPSGVHRYLLSAVVITGRHPMFLKGIWRYRIISNVYRKVSLRSTMLTGLHLGILYLFSTLCISDCIWIM